MSAFEHSGTRDRGSIWEISPLNGLNPEAAA